MWGRTCVIGICCLCCLVVKGNTGQGNQDENRRSPAAGFLVFCTMDTLQTCKVLQDFDYSILISNLLFLNWSHSKDANQTGFLQTLKYRLDITRLPVIKLSGNFQHSLGMVYYFDSIAKVQTDDDCLTINADLFLKTRVHLSFNAVLETQILNGYKYSNLNGSSDRTRISAFLTPLLCTISLGSSIEWKKLGSLNFGLSSLRITWLRDHLIAQRYAESLYGIPPGKNSKAEFGLSLHFMADREIIHNIQWSCDVLLFRNYKKPVDMTLKNIFSIRISKRFKTNIQTRILYEKQVVDHLRVENLVSFGFYFHR